MQKPLRRLSFSLDRFTTTRALIVLTIVFVLFSIVFVYVDTPFSVKRVEKLSDGVRILDQQRNYTTEMAYHFLDAYGESGRQTYRRILAADVFYPLLYGAFLSIAITWFFRRAFAAERVVQLLNLLPWLTVLFDYAENIGLYVMLAKYPTQLPTVVAITSHLSMLKQLLSSMSILALLIGIIFYLAKKAGLPRPYKTG